MSDITLIQCVDTKLDHAAPAKELYDSPYFKLMREYAEGRDAPYKILSAKHRLLDPETVIEPYNEKGLDPDQALAITGQLEKMGIETVHIIGGIDYTDPLVYNLERKGIDVIEVAQGLQIGERMARLKELTDA